MFKKGGLYYPTKEFKKRAWIKSSSIYKTAARNPVKFWEKLAQELFWFKKWKKGFVHKPPLNSKGITGSRATGSYFQWFPGGKINITANIFEKDWKKIKDKIALIWEPESIKEKPSILTYQDLFQEVNKFANVLKRFGVKKGDRVGIYLPMIPEIIIVMLACARIGAVHTVVFSAFSPAALKIRLQDTQAKVLITADGYYRKGQIINLKQNADEGVKETKIKKVIVVRRAKNKVSWQKTRDFWWHELIKNESNECKPEAMDAEDILFILYTSGSTGKPKGCVHTCGGYTVQAKFTGKWIFDWKREDVFWSTSDMGWITGHTYSCYSPLLNGVTFLIFEGLPFFPTPDRWAQIIEKYKVTVFYTAPTAIRMFEKYGKEVLKKHKFNTLRLLGSVGEPIDESAWQWYFKEIGKEKCPIVDTWWQTETGGILITSLPGIGPLKPAFTGIPFPGVRIDILDEKGKPCPMEKEGNLVILSPFAPSLLRAVYKNPGKYRKTYWSQYAAFDIIKGEPRPSGRGKKLYKIYFTSDSALKDKNGLIRIVGRVDDVIKVAGHRFTTGELESAINSHPKITECAVIGIPDKIKGEAIVAFIISKTKKSVENLKKEVMAQIQKEIGPIALPKEVYLVGDLPKTRSGKIMRRILRKLFTGQALGDLSTLANPKSVNKIKLIINK